MTKKIEIIAFYVGKKPCGCLVAACVDSPEHKEDTAETLSEWIISGMSIERVEGVLGEVRPNLKRCECVPEGQLC